MHSRRQLVSPPYSCDSGEHKKKKAKMSTIDMICIISHFILVWIRVRRLNLRPDITVPSPRPPAPAPRSPPRPLASLRFSTTDRLEVEF